MEAHTWQTVQLVEDSPLPDQRWGHAVTQVDGQMVIFGGYAYAEYMNDLWSFNPTTMAWTRIEATGDVPSERSNSTLHYDSQRQRLILFGGGAPEQRRFRSIYSLDWKTKNWTEIVAVESQNAPWERSYHVSQIIGHYLIVFGGESVADLGDLWVFDLLSRQWTEVKVGESQQWVRPRRFHSSVSIGSTMYVFGGSSGKVLLGDMISIDFATLLETGSTQGLVWREQKLRGPADLLTRWGHTSAVFDDKIYIYGGRIQHDHTGVLVIDPHQHTIRELNIEGAEPQTRRRHSASFIGSNMLIFGGSSNEYYNDLHYINVFEPRNATSLMSPSKIPQRKPKASPYDAVLHTAEGEKIPIRKGMIASNFPSSEALIDFLFFVDSKYSKAELQELLEVLTFGYGKLSFFIDLSLFGVKLAINEEQKNEIQRSKIREEAKRVLEDTTEPIYILSPDKYAEYVAKRSEKFADRQIVFNDKHVFRCNKALMARKSPYFEALFRINKEEKVAINLDSEFGDHRLMKIIVNYVETGLLVVCEGLCDHCWVHLCRAAQYFCLDTLFELSETYLTHLINPVNVETYLEFGLKENLTFLTLSCALFIFRNKAEAGSFEELVTLQKTLEGAGEMFEQLSEMFAFDLQQMQLKNIMKEDEDSSDEEVYQDQTECLVG